jgi:formate dehydrogenase
MQRRQSTFCRICEASCGLIATVEDGRVVNIEPNSEHVGTNGFACVKGLNQHHMYDSPDRLKIGRSSSVLGMSDNEEGSMGSAAERQRSRGL